MVWIVLDLSQHRIYQHNMKHIISSQSKTTKLDPAKSWTQSQVSKLWCPYY